MEDKEGKQSLCSRGQKPPAFGSAITSLSHQHLALATPGCGQLALPPQKTSLRPHTDSACAQKSLFSSRLWTTYSPMTLGFPWDLPSPALGCVTPSLQLASQ
jgi:hypothetical protein